jgi:membrane-bound serine protease (ClpP class)
VIPGFGVVGIAGIVLMVTGLVLSLLNNVMFDFKEVSGADSGKAIMTVLMGVILGMGGMIWLSSRIGKNGLLRRVSLQADLENAFSSPVLTLLTGKTGIAHTVLRPSGKVWIEGEIFDGIAETGFIDKGAKIRVVRFENAQVYVETIEN